MSRMTPTILTIEGEYFDFTAPEKWRGSIRTVAHALAHICRFGGHTRRFYSVAQHCVLMSYLVPPEHALHALLHEAGEPFAGDMPAPLKMLLPEYKALEKRIEAAVLTRFNLHPKLPDCIKRADLVLLARAESGPGPSSGPVGASFGGTVSSRLRRANAPGEPTPLRPEPRWKGSNSETSSCRSRPSSSTRSGRGASRWSTG